MPQVLLFKINVFGNLIDLFFYRIGYLHRNSLGSTMLSMSPSLALLHLRAVFCRCTSAGREGEGWARPGVVSHCGLSKGLDSHGGDGMVAGVWEGGQRGRPRRPLGEKAGGPKVNFFFSTAPAKTWPGPVVPAAIWYRRKHCIPWSHLEACESGTSVLAAV